MERVVVTGLGIISSIGINKEQVVESLQQGRSGIRAVEEYRDLGLRSQIAGVPNIAPRDHIPHKVYRFMGDAAAYSYLAMQQAIEDADLTPEQVSNPMTGLIAGSGGSSVENTIASADKLRAGGLRKVGPYRVSQTMCSTVSANLATAFHIKGVNYSIASACATSAHCIGSAAMLIRNGEQNIVFAGGGEELHWGMSSMFDAMGALSTGYNDLPEQASRAFDEGRDGFVIAGGGGVLVLESLKSAQRRNAKIYGELVGYGATSDGHGMVTPSGEGAQRCMRLALQHVKGSIDYLNAHGTSTVAGDPIELRSILEVFPYEQPHISSTKSMTGHSLGAAGVHEAIFSLLMLENQFIAPSININNPCPEAKTLPIVRSTQRAHLENVMSNSFGFGGTNASLVFARTR